MTKSWEQLDALCQSAFEVARDKGHELDAWSAPPREKDIARAAVCIRCGRVAYVRAEAGFVGAAGDALVQPCRASRGDADR